MKRSSGILMHISSLPSPYGIGTFGQASYDFVDQLVRAGQHYWQVLPLGPTSYGDSPYQSFSAFAGNPYFIDLDKLADEGLLDRDWIASIQWSDGDRQVDYGTIFVQRFPVLRAAFSRARENGDRMQALDRFAAENADWLEDYALFMALKDENGGVAWENWPYDVRMREDWALQAARERLGESMHFYQFLQYLFYQQEPLITLQNPY